MDYPEFCRKYYDFARKTADNTIAKCVLKSGPLNKYIDQDSVKDLGIMDALDKVFVAFDPERNVKVEGFLSTAVHNSVLTELGKENTRIRRFNFNPRPVKAKDSGEENKYSAIIPCAKASGSKGGTWEPAEMMDIFGKEKGKRILLKKVMCQIQKLSPSDQTVIMVWMSHDRRRSEYYDADSETPQSYVEEINDMLGLELTPNAVYLRLNKAIAKLRKLCTGINPDYNDLYVPGTSSMIFGEDSNSSSVIISGKLQNGEPVSRRRSGYAYSHIDYENLRDLISKKYYE